jgi:hypothetical protein
MAGQLTKRHILLSVFKTAFQVEFFISFSLISLSISPKLARRYPGVFLEKIAEGRFLN